MKVIFLDVDGVLNDYDTCLAFDKEYQRTGVLKAELNEDMVSNLKEIVDRTDAKIVLSSSWRLYGYMNNGKFVPKQYKAKGLVDMFDKYGMEIYDTVSYSRTRDLQILDYVYMNDVDDYIVIDDDSEELRLLPREVIIKTDFFSEDNETGLTKRAVKQAIRKLNRGKRLIKK